MKHLILSLFTLHFSLFTLHAASVEILPGPFADVRGNLVVETIPFDAAIDKPLRWVFADPGTMRPARIVKDLDLSALALYPDAPSTNFIVYIDADASGSYTPGEPFGVSNGRGNQQIELTDMSAITPRVNLWSGDVTNASDRARICGSDSFTDLPNRFEEVSARTPKSHVRVVRYKVDGQDVYTIGAGSGVVLEKDFEETSRDFLHEGDFLADGDFDIDWGTLYGDVVDWWGTQAAGCEVTNVTYLVVFNWDKVAYNDDQDTNALVKAHSTLVTRRFEKTRTVPTPVSAYVTQTNTIFSWKIENEDPWASWFGTTYTAFKVVASNETTEVFNSGIRRLPARDQNGVYTFSTSQTFQTSQTYTWRVAVYNAKFSNDTLIGVWEYAVHDGDPFSHPQPIGDEPPPDLNPTGTVDIAIYPGPYASRRGPIIIEQERNPFRYRTPQKWTIPDCRLRRPPVITHRVCSSDTNAPFIAYIDEDSSGSYTPGEPFGYSTEQSNNPNNRTINLTDMSAITPRVKLWSGDVTNASDRARICGADSFADLSNRFEEVSASTPKSHVRVVRYKVDGENVYVMGVHSVVVLEKDFCETSRDFLHEGDFLADGDFDIDWGTLYEDVSTWRGVLRAGCEVTNVSYLIVYNWDADHYESSYDTNTQVKANATLVTRRFERTRTVPTPVSAYATQTNTVFSWKIENEDPWASWFGTTYTAFKVVASNETTEVFNSGIRRLPARDINGVYTFQTLQPFNLSTLQPLTWRVAVYNAKFSNDTLIGVWENAVHDGDPFSTAKPITAP